MARLLNEVIDNLGKAKADLGSSDSRRSLGSEVSDELQVAYLNIIAELDYVTKGLEGRKFDDSDAVTFKFLIDEWKRKAAQDRTDVVQVLYAAMSEKLTELLNTRESA